MALKPRGKKVAARRKSMRNDHKITRIIIGDITKTVGDSGAYRFYNTSSSIFADLQSLYSEYKITSIDVEYQLYTQPNNNSNFPTLFLGPQRLVDVTTTPTSLDEVVQYYPSRTFQFGPSTLTYKQRFTPYVSMTNSTGKTFVPSPWISTLSTSVNHATHVDWIAKYNSATDSSHTIRTVVTYNMICRASR